MTLMESKELFRECGEHKLYFGLYLDDRGIVYGGYAIDDNELTVYNSINTLFNMWNSLTGDNLDSSKPIDWSFYDNIIIEALSSNHLIENIEGYSWEEIGLLCLQKLDESSLLGDVGRKLLEYKELFPRTIGCIAEWLQGQANAYGYMATSELVGGDDVETIINWIFYEERNTMRNIINGVKDRFLIVIDNDFIRDVQIAPNEKIEDISNDVGETNKDYEWIDTDDGDLAIGIYNGYNLEEALNDAAAVWNIDKRALHGYELK